MGQERRPWLEPELVKDKFLALSATLHPDRVHTASAEERDIAQDRFATLNGAYQCLRNHKQRLEHFLLLENGSKPDLLADVPPEVTGLFTEVGQACRRANDWSARNAAATSPLLRVQLFESGETCRQELLGLQKQLGEWERQLVAELRAADEAWIHETPSRGALLAQLEKLYRLFAYCGRWSQQVQDRLVRISI